MNDLNPQPGRIELRNFGLLCGSLIGLLFGAVLPWIWDYAYPVWPWVIGAILALWGLAAPTSLAPVYRGWMKFGTAIGWVNTRLILGAVFYVLITPMGLVMRLFGRDAMLRSFDRRALSYRVQDGAHERNDMEAPY
jgi:hypothetical protein